MTPFRFLTLLLFAVSPVQAQPTNSIAAAPKVETAGIYADKPIPPLKDLLIALAPTAKVSEERDGSKTHFLCAWPNVTVRLTVTTSWNGESERSGMKSWILTQAAVQTNMPAAKVLLQKIDSTVGCIGSVISPRYDSKGEAASLVLALSEKLDGYVFAHQAFYEPSGNKIIGIPEAPLQFKNQK